MQALVSRFDCSHWFFRLWQGVAISVWKYVVLCFCDLCFIKNQNVLYSFVEINEGVLVHFWISPPHKIL